MRKAKRNAGMMSPPGKIALHRAIRAHRRTSHEHYDLAQQIPFPTRLADFGNGSKADVRAAQLNVGEGPFADLALPISTPDHGNVTFAESRR